MVELSDWLIRTDSDSNLEGEIPPVIELSKNCVVIGRGSGTLPVDVIISARKDNKDIISRRHAEILRRNNSKNLLIKDLGSVNGLYVNKVKIKNEIISDGDIVQFGGLSNIGIGLSKTAAHMKRKLFHSPSIDRYSYSPTTTSESADYKCIKVINRDEILSSHQKYNNKRKQDDLDDNNFMGKSPSSGKGIKQPRKPPVQPLKGSRKVTPMADAATDNRQVLADKIFPNNDQVNTELEQLKHEIYLQKCKHSKEVQSLEVKYKQFQLEHNLVQQEADSLKESLQEERQELERANAVASRKARQVEQLESEVSRLKREIEDINLQLRISEKERESIIVKSKSEETKLQSIIKGYSMEISNLKSTPVINTAITQENPGACIIDSSSLRASLQCTLCHELLLDAVVLYCSHGFCRYCVESYWNEQQVVPQSEIRCQCPTCGAQSGAREYNNLTNALYMRSDHLDNLVWLMLETGTRREEQLYENRRQKHWEQLKSLGIDPDAPLTNPFDCKSSNNDRIQWDSRIQQQRRNNIQHLTRNNHLEIASTSLRDGSDDESPMCGYCAEYGHEESKCPHKDNDSEDSSSGEADWAGSDEE